MYDPIDCYLKQQDEQIKSHLEFLQLMDLEKSFTDSAVENQPQQNIYVEADELPF